MDSVTLERYQSEFASHKTVLESYVSGEPIPGFEWNRFDDIWKGKGEVPVSLRFRARKARSELSLLEWEICEDSYAKTSDTKRMLRHVGQSQPYAMLGAALVHGLIGEMECEEILRKMKSLIRTKYLEKRISIWKEVLDIEREYLGFQEPRLLTYKIR